MFLCFLQKRDVRYQADARALLEDFPTEIFFAVGPTYSAHEAVSRLVRRPCVVVTLIVGHFIFPHI
jgi:hypothetical protein